MVVGLLVFAELVEDSLPRGQNLVWGWLVVGVVLVLPLGVVVEFLLVHALQVCIDGLVAFNLEDGHQLDQQSGLGCRVCLAIADAESCVHALACHGVEACVLHVYVTLCGWGYCVST